MIEQLHIAKQISSAMEQPKYSKEPKDYEHNIDYGGNNARVSYQTK
jgi:hypothetical protein